MLIIAAYLHDISTVAHGFHEHQLESAEMAVEFLNGLNISAERVKKVEQAILAHTTAYASEESESIPIEGRILYDADKLGRLHVAAGARSCARLDLSDDLSRQTQHAKRCSE